jgi:hypothetical protein
MMFLGRVDGEPYVIQDASGKKRRTKTNEVSAASLLVDDKLSCVDEPGAHPPLIAASRLLRYLATCWHFAVDAGGFLPG